MQPVTDELEFIGSESDCSYLPERRSRMQYRFAMSLPKQRYEHLLERGWRRFGRTLFRPACRRCSECQSLRVDINSFRPTKSQRRAVRRNNDLQLIVRSPTVSEEHLALYNAFHRDMHERRGWPYREIDESQYVESFVDGEFSFSKEFQYRRDSELVALGIVDMTGDVMSSIYFVHAPELRSFGPGTMSVVRELEIGRETGHRWLYMGYFIRDCQSMNYKNRFGPHQILQSYAADDQSAVWEFRHET